MESRQHSSMGRPQAGCADVVMDTSGDEVGRENAAYGMEKDRAKLDARRTSEGENENHDALNVEVMGFDAVQVASDIEEAGKHACEKVNAKIHGLPGRLSEEVLESVAIDEVGSGQDLFAVAVADYQL